VLACAVGHCIGAGDVADLVAETFLQTLVPAGRFRSTDGGALPWLLGISRHVLARQRRSFVRRQRLLDRLSAMPAFTPDEADAAGAAIDAARLAPALATALSGLPAKDRELLLLVGRDPRLRFLRWIRGSPTPVRSRHRTGHRSLASHHRLGHWRRCAKLTAEPAEGGLRNQLPGMQWRAAQVRSSPGHAYGRIRSTAVVWPLRARPASGRVRAPAGAGG